MSSAMLRAVCVVACALAGAAASEAPVVETPTLGRIVGLSGSVLRDGIAPDSNVDSFLGIPYAKPPVGDLRFALPQPVGNLGTFEALQTGPACPQPKFSKKLSRVQSASEDCLTLNVYRKQGTHEGDDKPVIVYIHGGAFSMGSLSDMWNDMGPLSALGDQVVVAIQYRLGVFGFADMGDVAPGNLGFFDQRLALEWVQDHVRSFGGDPGRVTLMGVSAGSMSVSAHIMTPLNRQGRRLFHAGVMDAGVAAGLLGRSDESFSRMKKIAETLGCATSGSKMLKCLQAADGEKLLELAEDEDGFSPVLTFLPTDDGVFLPKDLSQNLRELSKGFAKVPLILGVAQDEGTMFSTYHLGSPFPSNLDTDDKILDWCAKLAFGYKYELDFSDEKVRNAVRENYIEKYKHPFVAVSKFMGDGTFYCSVNSFVRNYARHNDDVYVYRFERKLSKPFIVYDPKILGAFHFSPYLHFAGPCLGKKIPTPVDDVDRDFMMESIELVSKFARGEGTPSFRGVRWPDFGKGEGVLVWDEKPSVRSTIGHEDACKRVFPYQFIEPTDPKTEL